MYTTVRKYRSILAFKIFGTMKLSAWSHKTLVFMILFSITQFLFPFSLTFPDLLFTS